jgi:hypothetical protein
MYGDGMLVSLSYHHPVLLGGLLLVGGALQREGESVWEDDDIPKN